MTYTFYISLTTLIYALTFILSAKYMKEMPFERTGNWWSAFIYSGGMIYIGLVMMLISLLTDTICSIKRNSYHEYQNSIVERNLVLNGIFSVTLLPIIACASIIVRGYFIEILFAFMVIQWLFIVIMNFIYLKKLF